MPKLEPKYLPTEEEIREACQRIQTGWSEETREQRACVGTRWSVPTVGANNLHLTGEARAYIAYQAKVGREYQDWA